YRFANNEENYIIQAWTTSEFNSFYAKKIAFKLSSSDNGDWGMNTPGYFARDNLVASPTVGVKTLAKNDLKIYPNPSNGKFTVNSTESGEITVINAVGQVVYSGQVFGQTNIDLSAQTAGVYTLQYVTTTSTRTEKIVIR